MYRIEQATSSLRIHAKDPRSKIFLAVAAGWCISIGLRMVYPVLLPYLREDYGFSLTTAGLLFTTLWLAYAVGQIPGGALADRFGEGVTMAVSMVVAAIALFALIIAPNLLLLFVSTIAIGVTVALFGVVRLTSLANVYPDHVGAVHGLLGSAGDVANTILPPLATFVAAATIWQAGFGMLIPFFLIIAVALWRFVPASTSDPTIVQPDFSLATVRRVLRVLRKRSLVFVTLIQIIGFVVFQAFIGFYPTYLVEMKGFSTTLASMLFASVFLLGMLIRPVIGHGYDRLGVRITLTTVTVFSAIGLTVLPFVHGVVPLLVVTLFAGTMIGRGTVTMAYMTIQLPTDVQNMGLGTMRTVFFSVGAMSPLIFGAIADRGFFDEAFLLLAGLSFLSLYFVLRLPEA